MATAVARRVFMGSVVAGLPLVAVASAQPHGNRTPPEPFVEELYSELRDGLAKVRAADPNGLRQVATTLRIYASLQDHEAQRTHVQQATRKKGRDAVLRSTIPHAEVERLARKLGIPPWELPPHAMPNPANMDAALKQLVEDGLGRFMRRGAEALDQLAAILEQQGRNVHRVARQNCDHCNYVCGLADNAKDLMEAVCALAVAFLGMNPALNELCAAASATWMSFSIACTLCNIVIC